MKAKTEGKLIVTTGASRSGKTAITMQETRDLPRLLVWDPKGKWAEQANCQRLTSRRELAATLEKATAGRFAYVRHEAAEFDFWGHAAFAWTRQGHDLGRHTALVAEETAAVTSPGKAPAGFHRLVSQGLEFGAYLHAITQRPSESDKTCMGNASIIRTFRMSRAQDRKYMAAELDIDPQQILALAEKQGLCWIGRDMNTHKLMEGQLAF